MKSSYPLYAALLAGLIPVAAQAQVRIEEIVVTAKSREEKLQDVPLSISAFTSDTLERNQILDMRDLQRITPSLSIYSFTGRSDPSGLSLRGVAPNTSDERYQAISFFLDGIALSGQLASLDLASMERIEVIKGPQSATFGRATYSGAINYITRDPSGDDVTGTVKLRGASSQKAQGPDYYAGAYLSAPIAKDKLWLALQGSVERNAPMFRDHNDGSKIAEEKTQSTAATLFARPSDNWKIKARFSYDHDHDSAPATYAMQARDWLLAGVPTVVLGRGSGALWPTVVPDPQPGFTIDGNKYNGLYQPNSGNQRDRYFASLLVSYDLDGTELSYRSGYFYSNDTRIVTFAKRGVLPGVDPVFGSLIGTAVTPGATATSITGTREVFKNQSHQLMAVSPAAQRLRWRIGAYYFYETDLNWASSFVNALNPLGRQRGKESIENLAGFGGLDFDVTDKLTASAEARVAKETVGWNRCTYCGQLTTADDKRSNTDFLPRFTLNYKLTPENMLYALYSHGTKSGRYSFAAVTGGNLLLFATPEKLDNFEVGSKNTFLDGRMVVNLAAYFENVKQQQLSTSQQLITPSGQLTNITTTQNVGTSHVPGFEAEVRGRITEELSASFGLGYAGQRFTNKDPIKVSANTAVLFPGAALTDPIVLDGKTQASVPKWNGNVGVDYTKTEIFRGFDLVAHLDADYRGSFFADIGNIAKVPASWKVNTRIALSKKEWELALFVRNLFNDRTALGSGLAGNTSTCTFVERDTARFGTNQQCLFVAVARPRQIGLEAKVNF